VKRGLSLLAALAALALPGAASSDLNTGPQTILAILVTWGPQPYSPNDLRRQLFTDADTFVRHSSFGQAWLSGDVTPWLAIKEFDDCDAVTLSDMNLSAQNAAKAAGWDLTKYSRYVFAFPAPRACDKLGFGAGNTAVFLFGTPLTRTIEHELGHTFGLNHAWALACATCRPVEYADPYDAMGGLSGGQYNGLEKALAGWLKNVPTATSNGDYAIEQLEQPSPQPQALVIETARNEYWLDHREPLLEDAALSNAIMGGVEVHANPSPDDTLGASRYQPGNVLIRNPTGSGADAIRPGQSWGERGAFSLTVVDHVGTHVDVRFRWTDTTRPGRPPVYSPAGVVRSRKIDIEWGRATETGSGLASYAVLLDGKLRKTLPADAPRQLLVPTPRRGAHVVAVVAVDRAGNRSRPGLSRISVR